MRVTRTQGPHQPLGGPSTALGTPPQTPGVGIFNELPWLQQAARFKHHEGKTLWAPPPKIPRQTESEAPSPGGSPGVSVAKTAVSRAPSRAGLSRAPFTSHVTWLLPRQHLALESRQPRCEGGKQGRSLLGRQSHPDSCPPHSARSFQNPDSTSPHPRQAPAGHSREQKATSAPPPSAGVAKQRLKAKNQTDSEATR